MSKEDTELAMMDLREKQKAYRDQQEHVEQIFANIRRIANRQVELKNAVRRAQLTVEELRKLPEGHVVYQPMGRTYVRVPRAVLIEQQSDAMERSDAEEKRLVAEKQRATEVAEKEKAELQKLERENVSLAQTVQAMYTRLQQQQQPAGGK
ncbi:hypothetical protein STCU_03251 [Strigomonas culicis]|uniref:Prefoldin subunit 1 n=1 Tax=Strigomonas culicis TaxID=28005 RepID=S9USK1_9TRYP|nr:hypothetical protein STCU_03251 [Strigomonas culicis]|eukprot:EPY31774.1 hypothetical protein STCU_03251 [Strigomonas culicis]